MDTGPGMVEPPPEGLHVLEPCQGECGSAEPAMTTQFARMTLRQYRNSMRDLFGLGRFPDLKVGFPSDQPKSTFDNPIFELRKTFEVGEFLWIAYKDAAQKMAELATEEGPVYTRLKALAVGDSDQEQAEAFIAAFGLRTYRRPLSQQEVKAFYDTLYLQGAKLHPQLPAQRAGIRLVVQAMLQSPHFLYLVEQSGPAGDEVVALDGYERATRLATALWQTSPTPAMLQAAADGELDTAQGVRAMAAKMVEDERAVEVIQDFHAQLFEFEKFEELEEPGYPELAQDLRQEGERFVKAVVVEQGLGFEALMTAPYTFLNARLAPSYGLEDGGLGEGFERVELDPGQRAGMLTQVGWLRAHANGSQPEPIKRGLFLNEKILCTPLKPAPAEFELPEQDPEAPVTNRALFETATAGCGNGCHDTQINPAGFAFEHYDGKGAWRAEDNGYPVDASGTFRYEPEGFSLVIKDAPQLMGLVAKDYRAHSCYSFHWLEYVLGRGISAQDEPLIRQLAWASAQGTQNVKQMLVAIASSPSYMSRRPAPPKDP